MFAPRLRGTGKVSAWTGKTRVSPWLADEKGVGTPSRKSAKERGNERKGIGETSESSTDNVWVMAAPGYFYTLCELS